MKRQLCALMLMLSVSLLVMASAFDASALNNGGTDTEKQGIEWEELYNKTAVYADVPYRAWYRADVLKAREYGLMDGTAPRTFSPDTNMTRAMAVTVLWRMNGSAEVDAPTPFVDVKNDQWYSAAVRWAYATGAVNGTDATHFGTTQNMTRQDLAVVLYRIAGCEPIEDDWTQSVNQYEDASSIATYALPAVRWAVGHGYLSGSSGKLMPRKSISRAESATMLVRITESRK